MKNLLIGVALTIISVSNCLSQELEITSVNLVNHNIEIRYNLHDERIDRAYSIHLYTSNDNFIQSMNEVSGDIGIDIKVGGNKLLIWDAKKELGDSYDDDIALELKGNYYIPFITIEGIENNKIFKRGTSHDFTWSGGRGDNILNFELYNGQNLVKSFEERPNIGNTSILLPASVKPGTDYRFKVSDSKNRDEIVFSEPFTIKRKIPLGAKIGVSFVIGAGVGYLISTLLNKEGDEQQDIPLPLLPE